MMKKLIVLMILLFAGAAIADEYVNGYNRNNGTHVDSYHRTSPDNSMYNNYSTQGNTNPYTGSQGTVSPYSSYGNSGGYGGGFNSQPSGQGSQINYGNPWN
jgi:hypothetical protein